MMGTVPEGKTIKDYGYDFNSNGCLRKIDPETGLLSDEPFQFDTSEDFMECQNRYEDLGDAVTQYIYTILETELELFRLPVPKKCPEFMSTFAFATKDYDRADKLLILIHGIGGVRAGQWARSIIINDSLNNGSQIPYVKKAIELGYGVIITNSNENYIWLSGKPKNIPGSATPEQHAYYVWKTYIEQTAAKSIAIVAHSYGGHITGNLSKDFRSDFEKRVKAVAFTDSVHTFKRDGEMFTPLVPIARNWVTSSEPIDTPVETTEGDIEKVSAGHMKHGMTSCSAIESVFKFIEDKFSQQPLEEQLPKEQSPPEQSPAEQLPAEQLPAEQSPAKQSPA